MAKKIQLQDANGNVLHPLTLGECVAMDNGENLDTLMSKSQMFTPTITQDKSMFKVGTGVDVDYSANVKDGAYESLMFKGKSLVNLATQGVNYGLAKHSNITSEKITVNVQASKEIKFTVVQEFSEWIYITVKINLDMLKPNTKYLVVGESIKNINYARICRGDTTHNLEQTPYPYFGNSNYVVLTTNDLTNYVHNDITLYLRPKANLSVGSEVHVKNVMLIEYQEDMENWGIPYFEGLCDSKMPILRNVGKNLANQSKYEIEAYVGGNDGVTVTIGSASKNTQSIIMEIEPNVSIVASSSSNSDRKVLACFNHFPTNGSKATKKTNNGYITTDTDTKYVMYYYNSNTVANGIVSQVQIEESPSPTQYEPYKTNILRTSEEIVLREVNGIQDTYNALTGEYTQRIEEVIFDGSVDETWSFSEMKGENYRFGMNLSRFGNGMMDRTPLICNRLKVGSVGQETTQEQIVVYNHTTSFEVRITLSPSTISSNNIDEFRRYLQENPVIIQYELAEPVTTIVKPSTMTPFAYQNGHVILESGFEGQSLLPEIEYSVVTGRTGQVTQNTKVLRKQEQQIIGLEELLLTQIVQMEYERTLLQFDYELQMMMLG